MIMIKHLVQPPRRWLCKALLVCCGSAVVGSAHSISATEYTFNVNPGGSVDMAAAGITDFFPPFIPTIASTFDTQSFPLAGTITLDVEMTGNVVQSVDFVEMNLEHIADPLNPVIFEFTTLSGFPGAGNTSQIWFPHDAIPPDPVANPHRANDVSIALDSANAGTETGTGGVLNLSNPVFDLIGTGRYVNATTVGDGWPLFLDPYPNEDTFPGAPTDTKELVGTVTIVDDQLHFDATLFSFGTGGNGALRTAIILDGAFTATAPLVPVVLGDLDGNGVLDNLDIDDFVMALIDPDAYAAAFPVLNPDELGDFDGDGSLTNLDIFGFVGALQTPSALALLEPVPEPTTAAMLLLCLTFSQRRRCSRD
ncbi:MAG: hypothetical protein AAGB26_05365 [Planctomycetota bacterium]